LIERDPNPNCHTCGRKRYEHFIWDSLIREVKWSLYQKEINKNAKSEEELNEWMKKIGNHT